MVVVAVVMEEEVESRSPRIGEEEGREGKTWIRWKRREGAADVRSKDRFSRKMASYGGRSTLPATLTLAHCHPHVRAR